jgi:predicted acylesterase/phospholipase RssA
MVNNSPMLAFLRSILNPKDFPLGTRRKWTITAGNVADGEYTEFNQTNTEFSEIADAAVSSSSIPGAFSPHYFKGNWYMDGGTIWTINTVSAIKQCLADGYTED